MAELGEARRILLTCNQTRISTDFVDGLLLIFVLSFATACHCCLRTVARASILKTPEGCWVRHVVAFG